jgi:hypothetical protein
MKNKIMIIKCKIAYHWLGFLMWFRHTLHKIKIY